MEKFKLLESWAERLPEILKGYELKDVSTAGETGLFWRALLYKLHSVLRCRYKVEDMQNNE